MVIGFDGSRAFTDKRTGTENYSFQLLKNLAKIDKKNKYIVYLRTQDLALQGWPKNFQFKIINWPRLWTQGGLALQTFKDKLDVLFVPSHTLPLIKRPGLKTVVTVHDLGSEYLPGMHQLKQRLYLSLMQRYQLKTASKIIAVSKATKEDLVKRIGLDQKKIEVVYEGYDNSLYKSVKNDLLISTLKYYELLTNNYYLFVGTVQPRKNLERVILAYSQAINDYRLTINEKDKKKNLKSLIINHKSPDLVIAGSKGWLSDEIYALPKKLGIEDRVKFLGYVPDKDLPALYSGAIAFVYPSLFEGFGLPILEAQACGCPVITSDISSMPEVSGDGALLVDPYSVEEIAEVMVRVKSQESRVKIMKAGLENVKRFSWEKCAREVLHILEGV